MILTLIGLILTFVGTVVLVIDALVRFGKPKSAIFTPIHYGTNGKPTKFVREKQIYDSRGMPAGYQEIKITKEEIILIVSLSLISFGFLLQILDYLFQNFPQLFQFP